MARKFGSLMALAREIESVARREQRSDERARGHVGHELVSKIQDRLGKESLLTPSLKPATQAQRVREGYAPRTTLLKTGALRVSYSSEHVTRRETDVGSPSIVALAQEMGNPAKNLPARKPMARTARDNDQVLFRVYASELRRELKL